MTLPDRFDRTRANYRRAGALGDMPSLLARFFSHARQDGDCWLWTGATNQGGYGKFWSKDGTVRAHRWVYQAMVGPIPEGLTLDHLCGNPACVNPQHLDAVTIRVNVLRGDGPTAINARKTHCKRGHEFTPENTHRDHRGYRRCMTCRREAALARTPVPVSPSGAGGAGASTTGGV